MRYSVRMVLKSGGPRLIVGAEPRAAVRRRSYLKHRDWVLRLVHQWQADRPGYVPPGRVATQARYYVKNRRAILWRLHKQVVARVGQPKPFVPEVPTWAGNLGRLRVTR